MASPPGMTVDEYLALGLDRPAPDEVNGRSNDDVARSINHPADSVYHPCPEALSDAPEGTVRKFADWDLARRYPNTVRDLWVYTPHAFDPGMDHRLLVCNDGYGYLARSGPVRATRVLDTLHASGEIAPTVAIFVNPGRPRDYVAEGPPSARYNAASLQRSQEYDSVSPVYGEFLLDEVLPFAAAELGTRFTEDPAQRSVCGISSGGICAFTAAWHFPDRFGRVISHCGSFTNIRGGHHYPYLIRATERKPLRIFLQSGANDAGTLFGDWALANQTVANALQYAGYDFRFEFGVGGHSLRHGGALFADTLRWLWRA